MNKQRALYLLEEGFNDGEKDIALVHGTSTETISRLLSTGVIPGSVNPRYRGWIYFFPVKGAFERHALYDSIPKELSLLLAEEYAGREAEVNEESLYINSLIGTDTSIKRDGTSNHDLSEFIDVTNPSGDGLIALFKHVTARD